MALVAGAGQSGMQDKGGSPPSTTTPAWNPKPLNPTPAGMQMWAKMQKSLAKRQAANTRRAGQRGAKGPVTAPNDPSGTGGPNDPAWQSLANLYKNGLPG